MIGIIVAMNANRVIGVNGGIPWRYPADIARFKQVTMGSTVIMGRKTWESIPAKYRPLEGRFNIVMSSSAEFSTEEMKKGPPLMACNAFDLAVKLAQNAAGYSGIWFIGGARIYAEAMQYADVIDVTWVPWETEYTSHEVAVYADDDGGVHEYAPNELTYFPSIDEAVFAPGERTPHPDDPQLQLQRFERRYTLKDNEKLRQQGVLKR